jgi:hypothetical protein
VNQIFRDYAEDMPGDRPAVHQLRHSFGSERAGQIDALVVRDLMGHRSLRTTQQYARVNPDLTPRPYWAIFGAFILTKRGIVTTTPARQGFSEAGRVGPLRLILVIVEY